MLKEARSIPVSMQFKHYSLGPSRNLQASAIVIGGYGFAHGEPGAKKALAAAVHIAVVAQQSVRAFFC
jgi:hypothetical protein